VLVEGHLKHRIIALIAFILVVVVALSVLTFFNQNSKPIDFYVGVEYAYGDQVSEVKALVDKVKDYTNLFVIGSVSLTFNEAALTEACDYIYDSKLSFIVQFTGFPMYNYSTTQWMLNARATYGDKFIGIYRYDEPGGNQLDRGQFMLIKDTTNYVQTAQSYVGNLTYFSDYYLDYAPKMFTADYGLYWFDYQSNYTCIFAEFVGNQSRDRHIALCRGAADAFGKDWGVIVTWKYDQFPYLEDGGELFNDLVLAYKAGAKSAIVFSYPQIMTYGTLNNDHFEALEKFWSILQNDPASLGSSSPHVAYIVPSDYGFGFRASNDTIWGLFPSDNLSAKIFDDVNFLLAKYDTNLDILYDGDQADSILMCYDQVYLWNQTIS
jgi:hypothetical protein